MNLTIAVTASASTMPKAAPVGGTFSGSGREGAMLTMQASDLWKERVGKELEVIHHGPFEKKRLPWEHTSDRDQHNWLAANSAAELPRCGGRSGARGRT